VLSSGRGLSKASHTSPVRLLSVEGGAGSSGQDNYAGGAVMDESRFHPDGRRAFESGKPAYGQLRLPSVMDAYVEGRGSYYNLHEQRRLLPAMGL
jgi:hypothetical protein